MIGQTIQELAVGDAAELTREVTAEQIREYVGAVGDDNPIHSDPAFAATTRFGEIISPGMLTGGLISAVIGTRLPGPGTIYLSQNLRFLKPVHVGDTITARVEVTETLPDRNRLCLRTICLNQDGEVVLEGEAWVMPPKVHVVYDARCAERPTWGSVALAPAALAVRVMSFWAASGLALASHALQLSRPRPVTPVKSSDSHR